MRKYHPIEVGRPIAPGAPHFARRDHLTQMFLGPLSTQRCQFAADQLRFRAAPCTVSATVAVPMLLRYSANIRCARPKVFPRIGTAFGASERWQIIHRAILHKVRRPPRGFEPSRLPTASPKLGF